ncbi:MAG: bifunctional diaminohydroxyphosphoribosylaminopyrimidine deaminase/5-amino-6-(5-phosphoribosylamino)uracil reductase RibD [Endomicrobium sp.]|jgi:diaminohydroxyphosphoribosylaminopyrimidine deaminase/5-amino-6-(5-phosphoribosylamino)uracil reductase|nr:bifunctional diaminohydroxyphosphoribosylaminopyrimidine deaminase/5-amino-6-(5-phosphoribosylamino)uracil reductase RibD [Endomicrobium sp.]
MDKKYMRMAIDLAKKGKGKVYTNPLVGCLVVKDNKVVGKGWHKYFGGKHAEINALDDAGKNAKNADLYVTLEPCNNYGKQPPCVLAIIKAGIKRVFFSLHDKNASGTKELLEKKGVEVYKGMLKKESKILIKRYLKFLQAKPKVTVKAAITLDGKIATHDYDSRWITSEKSRNLVHRMRSQYDAVLVGCNTALKDNPFLTAHSKKLKNPIRVVIDSKLKLPKYYHLLDGSVPTIVVHDSNVNSVPKHLSDKEGIILASVDVNAAKKDFNVIIKKLNSLSVKKILIEGGSKIISSALFSNAVDDIFFFVAPKISGGRSAVPVVGGEGAKKISESIKVKNMKVKKIGNDLLITGNLKDK